MATLLGLLFMAQKNCDLCIAVIQTKWLSLFITQCRLLKWVWVHTPAHRQQDWVFPMKGFLQVFLFWAPQALSQCLQIHSNQKTIHQNFFSYCLNHAHLSDELVSFIENLFKFSLFVCFHWPDSQRFFPLLLKWAYMPEEVYKFEF